MRCVSSFKLGYYGYINGNDTYHIMKISAKCLLEQVRTAHGIVKKKYGVVKNTSACIVAISTSSLSSSFTRKTFCCHSQTWPHCTLIIPVQKSATVFPVMFRLSDDHCSLAYVAMGAEKWSSGVLQYLAMNGPNHPLTRNTWPGLQGYCHHFFVYQVHLGRGYPEVSA